MLEIMCIVRTRWRDKRDIFLQLLVGAKVDSRAWYIHGGATERTHAVGVGTESCLDNMLDVLMNIGGGGTRGTFLVTLVMMGRVRIY